ncbi:hypothetical protein [Parachlamydia sp. AcF125]|uniref:hypothetical protein n=1 Tax=Parachlamydia sp. AcF125 TaxID=2795736 RepID=UPI001BC90FE0|nr:hypothetical protein [Parachlamydia sp. AcF125]MBS4169058.1 hypothetical protein [Parachlamydia sp. AcF125]
MSSPSPEIPPSLPTSQLSSLNSAGGHPEVEESHVGYIQGWEQVTLIAQSGSSNVKDISNTIQNLAKDIFQAQQQLTSHSTLIASGDKISEKDEESLKAALNHSKQGIQDVELQLAHVKSGDKRAQLEGKLHVLKARLEALNSQYEAMVSKQDARRAAGTIRREINHLLFEGSKNPLQAAQNFEKAKAQLAKNDPSGTLFPELNQKLQGYAGKYLKLSSEEKSIEKKLKQGKFESGKVSKEEAKFIESIIRKKIQVLSLETDTAVKHEKFAEIKKLTRGLSTNISFLSHFEEMRDLKETSLGQVGNQSYSGISLSEMRILIYDIGTKKADEFTAQLPQTVSKTEGSQPRAKVPEAEISSSEKKEAQFKVGLLTYLFNRPVGKIANRLNTLAINNLKIEKAIEAQLSEVAGKTAEQWKHADGKQIHTLNGLIQQEKEALAKLKTELGEKGPSRLASEVEKAILKQEAVIARLEAKRDVLKSQFGDDYKQGKEIQKRLEESIQKALANKNGHSGEALFEAFNAQLELAALAKHSPQLQQMSQTAIARLTSPEVQTLAKLTKSEEKLKGHLLEASSQKDLQRLMDKAGGAEIRDILAKETLNSLVSQKTSEESVNAISLLKAQVALGNPLVLSSASDSFHALSAAYEKFVGADAERNRTDFYAQRAEILNAIATKGFIGDLTKQMEQLREKGTSQGAQISKELGSVEENFSSYVESRTGKTRAERGVSERLQEGKSLTASDKEAVQSLLNKNAERALSVRGEGTAEAAELAAELTKLKGVKVGKTWGQRFTRAMKFKKASEEVPNSQAIWSAVLADPALAKNLAILRDQSERRLKNILEDLGTIWGTSPIDDTQLRVQIDKLTKETEIYAAFSLQAGQESPAVQLIRTKLEAEITKQVEHLLSQPTGDFEANLQALKSASDIVIKALMVLPSPIQLGVKEQMVRSEAFKEKIEQILPRFATLFEVNSDETAKISSSSHQVKTLANLVKVDNSKLTFLQQADLQNNFVSAYKELINVAGGELAQGQAGYDQLLSQKEELKKILTAQESASLEKFLEKFAHYLTKLKPVADRFREIEEKRAIDKKTVSAEVCSEAAEVLESEAFKELAAAVQETLGAQRGMEQVNATAARLIAQQGSEAKIFDDAGLGVHFTLIKHPIDRFLKWPGLLESVRDKIAKKSPPEGSELAQVQNQFARLQHQVQEQANIMNRSS